MEDEHTHFPLDTTAAELTVPGRKFKKPLRLLALLLLAASAVLVALYAYLSHLNQPPENFPVSTQVEISGGTEVRAITEILETNNVVRSKTLLYYVLVLFFEPTSIKASTYVFPEPVTTFAVAKRLAEGDFNSDLIRFTHFEGERATQIATRAAALLYDFDEERFVRNAEPYEGRLFPETYFIPESYTDEDMLTLLRETFDEQIEPLAEKIAASGMSLDDILVLASIIEREANTLESKQLVSSVLHNRLDIGMALQADASIEYVLDKPLAQLTPADLEIDSMYNTYLYTGLPPTPIGNPGIDAIMAAMEPAESDYFYYITDDYGIFHYAESYNEHLRNIEMYLR